MTQRTLDRLVFNRDRGVCQRCGLDAEALHQAYKAALAAADERHAAVMRNKALIGYRVYLSNEQRMSDRRTIESRWRALGFAPGSRPYQTHHVTALSEGGRNDPANCVTLCTVCHAAETKATRGRLARKPVKHLLELREDRNGRTEWR